MPRPLTIATSMHHYTGNSGKAAGEKSHKTAPPFHNQLLGAGTGEAVGISSIDNLLMNIQGLLKVAMENARHHEQQTNYEKGRFMMLHLHALNILVPESEVLSPFCQFVVVLLVQSIYFF